MIQKKSLLMLISALFTLDLGDTKSHKSDTGILNLLKMNLELLLVKIFRYSQLQEARELERLKHLLFHYYKHNKTSNISEIYKMTPMEDFEMFTGKPSIFSITEVFKYIKHNQEVKYKDSWKKVRRRNHSAGCRDYLKSCLRKLPHVNASLARLVFDDISPVTIPTNPFFEKFKTTNTRRPTKKWTRPKTYLRYVSYSKRKPTIVTTTHRCEHC